MAGPPSTQLIVVLVVGMLITGCSNSLWSKWQDMQCVVNCDGPPSGRKVFEQPLWQSLTMFYGETLCLMAHFFIKSRFNPFAPKARAALPPRQRVAFESSAASRLGHAPHSRPDESAILFNESAFSLHEGAGHQQTTYDSAESSDVESGVDAKLLPGSVAHARQKEQDEEVTFKKAALFWLPSACDIMGTTFMNIGLLFVPVSIYQMLRGALVLWTGLFSVLFLGRKMDRSNWASLGTVMLGVAVVGLSSIGAKKEEKEEGAGTELGGIFVILFAQIFTASQFVIEEKIMARHHVEPLVAVGSEGVWGSLTVMAAMPFLHYFIGSKPSGKGGYFDVPAGWHQIIDSPAVWGSSIAIMISISLFNFCGLAVTKTISATSRSTIDTSRTVGIWIFSLAIGWETFKWLQLVGFSLLVYGTFVFNGIMDFPHWMGLSASTDVPAILVQSDLSDSDPASDDDDDDVRSRVLNASGTERPMARRSGSGRRGEISPLLKAATATSRVARTG